MDKNFINIDDLVKQRLGGGEEQERSGSWQNMRELLDKEMPREQPVGMFYWRRFFSAVAVLLLICTIGAGGYKIASSIKEDNAQNIDATVSGTTGQASGSPDAAIVNKQTTGSGNKNQQNKQGNDATVTDENHPIAANEVPVINNEINQQLSTPDPVVTNEQKVNGRDARNNNNNSDADNAITANHKQADRKKEGNADNRSIADKKTATAANGNGYTHTGKKELPYIKTVPANVPVSGTVNNSRPSSNPAVAVSKTNEPAHTANKTKMVNGNEPTEKQANTAVSTAAHISVKHTNTQGVNDNSRKGETKPAAAFTINHNAVAANIKTTAGAKNNVSANSVNKTQNTNADKMVVSSHAPSAGSIKGVTAGKVMDKKNSEGKDNKAVNTTAASDTRKNSKAANSTGANHELAAATKQARTHGGDKMQKLNTDKARQDGSDNAARSANALKSKRVIQKMALVEHFIKTNSGEGFYKLDTVSVVTLTEELGIITETKTTVPVNTPAKGDANSTTKNKAMADSRIIPAAAKTRNSLPATKEEAMAQKTSGASAMENLSAAFNDVKYKVAAVQFAPGLTAGINGTFFGPNSFKGFQFGVAGNFVFDRNISVMTELKYFHRINNNYDLNDNYYTYTPLGTGGYRKELQLNSYSFSTLHSFELPVAFCYTESKFSFFAGGNFIYSFAINTGAASKADPNNILTAASVGNDNAPQLKEKDFSSRIGFGYLLGISYQVSPNVVIDFRNVQTVWDNSGSEGAKKISRELYKSPSLQLSFGYRLGGNKNKK